MRKLPLCIKVSFKNKQFIRQLSKEKNRSVSNIVDTCLSDLYKQYQERNACNENIAPK